MSTDSQRTKWRRNIGENFVARVGCSARTLQTDDRQTDRRWHIARIYSCVWDAIWQVPMIISPTATCQQRLANINISVWINAWRGVFDLFAPVTLTTWPSYTNVTRTGILYRYIMCATTNFLRRGFWKLSSDKQTDIHTDGQDQNYIPRRFAGGQ